MRAPPNTLVHVRDTPDTLRSSGGLDLTREPVVLTVPDTCGRYYALWFWDEQRRMFASIGARTTGTRRGAYAVVGPGWYGSHLAPGLTPIASPTPAPRLSGYIEAAGESDADALRRAYEDFRLLPLSRWLDGAAPVTMPNDLELSRDGPGDPLADVLHTVLDTDREGRPLSGEHRYVVRFRPDAEPPAHGFWSLSTRTATEVHSIGDLHGLAIDLDGSLPIYIQHRPPRRERRSNWLPAPEDRFSLGLDLYWPAAEALQGRWSPPPVERA